MGKVRFFCINICCFFYQVLFFCTKVAQTHPSFIKIVHVFDLYSAIKPERTLHCAVYFLAATTIPKNGFAVDVLALMVPKFEIGSRLRPPDANNCCIFSARLLGNSSYIATGSQRVRGWCQVATTILPSKK